MEPLRRQQDDGGAFQGGFSTANHRCYQAKFSVSSGRPRQQYDGTTKSTGTTYFIQFKDKMRLRVVPKRHIRMVISV